MTDRESKRLRLTGCMTFQRAVRTAKRLAKSTRRSADVYDCGRTASCYRVTTRPIADTWCTRQTSIQPQRKRR